MPDAKACYRKLRNYKYQLKQDYTVNIGIKLDNDINTGFIALTADGNLTVKIYYAWDGPSGITIDTKSFMRGSLVHDALYQLMREKYLDYEKHRQFADDLLKEICIADGMSKFRAWYVHKFVRLCGEKFARPSPEPQDELICVP